MGAISITTPKTGDTYTAIVIRTGEPALAQITVYGTCTGGTHGITVALYAGNAKDPTQSATANGTSWQTTLENVAVGTYKIVASCANDKGGTDTATVDSITVQKT